MSITQDALEILLAGKPVRLANGDLAFRLQPTDEATAYAVGDVVLAKFGNVVHFGTVHALNGSNLKVSGKIGMRWVHAGRVYGRLDRRVDPDPP